MNGITIVVASHNGAARLPTTLAALTRATLPELPVQYILVDNASDDATSEVFAGFRPEGNVTCLYEARRGKSFALNRALSMADDEFIAFIDDDITISEGWLSAYLEAARAQPDCVVFSGQIRPDWARPSSSWLRHMTDAGRAYGCTPSGRQDGPQPFHQAKGGNLFVRWQAVGAVRFCTGAANFGAPGTRLGGEDTKFVRQILGSDDHSFWYVPEALVHHQVKRREMSLREVMRRYVLIGEGRAARAEEFGQAKRMPSASKLMRRGLPILPDLVRGRTGAAAVRATKVAMLYGERRYWRARSPERQSCAPRA
ncbi:MAG: glycosyltransferase family A protein [Celeribacter sp.]|jgi:glycosyltransferase involved in cell wall biosynthesis